MQIKSHRIFGARHIRSFKFYLDIEASQIVAIVIAISCKGPILVQSTRSKFNKSSMADDYDSDEEEMLARADELRALEADGVDGNDDDYSASQQGNGGKASRRSSAYSGYSGYSGQSGYSGEGGGRSYRSDAYDDEDYDDDGQGHYDRDQDEDDHDEDEDEDERSYHTQRSHRSQASAYSHHTHDTTGSTTAKKSSDKKSKKKETKSKSRKQSEPDRPDQLSTIISKEDDDQLLAYNAPPVPLRFSSQYLRGPFGVGEANVQVLGGGSGGTNGIKMSRKQRERFIKDGLGLNIGPLIVYDDDCDENDNGSKDAGDGKPSTVRPGSLIYGCRGPASSSTSPSSSASDPLGLYTNIGNTSGTPFITAADLLRWLTCLIHHHSIRRILCLLNSTELQSIAPPAGYQRLVESQGAKVTMLGDLTQPGARDMALGAMEGAVRAGERIATHCSGGEHRTGNVMALWLCRHGDGQVVDEDSVDDGTDEVARTVMMSPEEAVKRVAAEASRAGVSRHPDVEQVRTLLEEGELPLS